MIRTRRTHLIAMLIVALSCVLAVSAMAKDKKEKPKALATYSMAILPPAGADDSTPSEIWVEIDRFTTPDEKAKLLQLIETKGQNAALTAAQNSPVGRLKRPGGLATNVLYAWKETDPAGDKIVIASLRFPVYPDAVVNADPMLMPFTIASFVPTADAKGKGKIFGAAALTFDKAGKLEVTAFDASVANLGFARIR